MKSLILLKTTSLLTVRQAMISRRNMSFKNVFAFKRVISFLLLSRPLINSNSIVCNAVMQPLFSFQPACPIDGKYTKWSSWKCSVTCGRGVETRTRTCTNPPPSNGGKDCKEIGPAKETRACKKVRDSFGCQRILKQLSFKKIRA